MSKAVNSKWKKTFPDTIGNQNRPATGVDDTQPFETGAFPQYMANDPVRYDLQNAAMSQSMSNDARLKEMIDARGKELDDHKVDPGAHKTGIAGNAATATKVVTTAATGASANIAEATMASNDLARIRVSGETDAGELALETADDGSEPIVARQYTGIYTTPVRTAKILDESGNTSFPGTVFAPKFTGGLNGNSATATKLKTPRTLSLSGKAAGSATFDGSANVSINVTSVNADTATKATQDSAGNVITDTYLKKAGDTATGDLTAPNFVGHLKGNADTATKARQDSDGNNFTEAYVLRYMDIGSMGISLDMLTIGGLFVISENSAAIEAKHCPEPGHAGSILVMGGIASKGDLMNPKGCTQVYTTYDTHNSYKRDYDSSTQTWSEWRKCAFEDSTVAKAQKLSTPRKINITGNATGSGTFDGSGDISISTTVNESKHAVNADTATNDSNGDKINDTYLKKATVIDVIYPIGSIYMSMSATNPATLFGVGTWKRISQGRMLLGADDSTYKAGATGGEATHTLTVNEIPAHSHGISTSGDHNHKFYGSDNNNGNTSEGAGKGMDTGGNGYMSRNMIYYTANAGAHTHTISNSGGGAAHNNMSPYLVCYIWQRTA